MSPLRLLTAFLLFVLVITLAFAPSSAAAQTIQVTAAEPSAGEQGTLNLNVRVLGKGFKNGANAEFLVSGTTNPGGIVVKSTTFVSATELIANIDIADTADLAKFDIKVTVSGRVGKGTELFSVTQAGAPQSEVQVQARLNDTAGYTIQGDGLNGGWYVNSNAEKVSSVVFSGSGDWQLDMLGSSTRKVLIVLNPVSGDPTGRPFQAAVVPARFMNCQSPDPNNLDSFWDAAVGGPAVECNLRLRFTYNRKEYVLLINGANGSSRTSVVCTSSSGTLCRNWTSSLGTAETPGIGMLQSVAKGGAITDIGLYYVSYSAEVVWP